MSGKLDITFKKLDSDPNRFFDLLPSYWQEEIVPYWAQYQDSASIYVLEEDNQVIGGGIVFSTCPPDIDYFKNDAKQWFDNGYLYLGFIWISEERRNRNLGSLWLKELKNKHPQQKYWLLIEEEKLHGFYRKNGFVLEITINNQGTSEWLYTLNPLSS